MRKNKMKTLFIGLTAFVLVGIGAKDTFADEIMWDESDEILQAGGLIHEKTTGMGYAPRYLQEAGRSSRITVDEALYTGLSMAEDAVDLTGYNLKQENLKDLYVSNILIVSFGYLNVPLSFAITRPYGNKSLLITLL